jgi:1-phosphofructokinase
MIVTLTPNPSIDRTVTLAGPLRRGAVQRADAVTSQAGGKGVNISRAAVGADVPTVAVLPADAEDAFLLELRAAHIPYEPVPPAGPVRVNVTISEPDGTTTKLNSPGPTVTASDLASLTEAVRRRAGGAGGVGRAGARPPAPPPPRP